MKRLAKKTVFRFLMEVGWQNKTITLIKHSEFVRLGLDP